MHAKTNILTALAAGFTFSVAFAATPLIAQEAERPVLFPAKKVEEEPAKPVKKLKKKKTTTTKTETKTVSKTIKTDKKIAAKPAKKTAEKQVATAAAKKKLPAQVASAEAPVRKSLFSVLFNARQAEEPETPVKKKPAVAAKPVRKIKPIETTLALATPLPDPVEPVAPVKKGKKAKTAKPVYDPKFEPQTVAYASDYAPGTIVIDSKSKFLYLIEGWGTARRYGVAVGKEGLGWTGEAAIGDMQEWPRWIPTKEMVERDPEKYLEYDEVGMDGGPENPLGARAMYLYQGKKDTYIRIHGTNAPWSIGHAASNGCFRMVNEHVMDLYNRVGMGTKVVVL